MAEKCFCLFNGYEVKDAAARKTAAENASAIEAEADARAAAIEAEAAARSEAIGIEEAERIAAIEAEADARAAAIAAEAAARAAAIAGIQVDQMKLVWENASPTSDFATQTVTLNLQEYDFVIIEFRSTASSASRTFEWVRVGTQGILQSPVNVTSSGAYMTWIMRTAKVTTTNIQFAKGYIKGMTEADAEESAARCIPTRIYGVRGLE